MTARGHHRVFLGMAPGVGKTYRMLEEAHVEAAAGRDVVIGYLEAHGRADVLALAQGLEVVARRRVSYHGTCLEEMDTPAIIRRAPALCLVDELAHTDVPGLEHEKRHQDVEDLLTAGISVYSTVNVQHLQTLSDRVAAQTGLRVHEVIPDDVVDGADEVVLVDVTPELLRERLAAGKIYPPEMITTALQNFFTPQNLIALREVALLHVAEDVEAAEEQAAPRPEEATRYLMALDASASSARLLHRAWRHAEQAGSELDVLIVTRRRPSAAELQRADALRHFATLLGSQAVVRQGDLLGEAAGLVADGHVTHLLLPPADQLAARHQVGTTLGLARFLRRMSGVTVVLLPDR